MRLKVLEPKWALQVACFGKQELDVHSCPLLSSPPSWAALAVVQAV